MLFWTQALKDQFVCVYLGSPPYLRHVCTVMSQDSIPDEAETEEGQSVPPLTLTVLSVSVCEVRQMERETVAFELTQVQEKHDMRVYSMEPVLLLWCPPVSTNWANHYRVKLFFIWRSQSVPPGALHRQAYMWKSWFIWLCNFYCGGVTLAFICSGLHR